MSAGSGELSWFMDRFGFPYLPIAGQSFAVSLLPITRAQAELWLGDPAGPGDDWYAELLAHSPRGSRHAPGPADIPRLLFTGLLPEDAHRFAMWMGPAYRLPTPSEWRAGDIVLSSLTSSEFTWLLTSLESGNGHAAVPGLVRKLADGKRKTARELCLLKGGVLEWVTMPGNTPGALGRPTTALSDTLILDPQKFDPVVPIVPRREPLFGARLIRQLDPPRG